MMKHFFITSLLCVSCAGLSLSPAQAFVRFGDAFYLAPSHSLVQRVALTDAQQASSEAFVAGLVDRALSFLSDGNLSEAEKAKKFEALLDKKFDLNRIGKFAMGRHWRSTTKPQQTEYLKLFRRMILGVYTQRFSEYSGQKVRIIGSRAEGKNDAMVSSVVEQKSGPNIRLDWRVRYTNGSYRVIDVIVEGVSMALTQRSDFASVIQRGGGDIEVLLAHLRP